jgi:hypothetical protein
MDPDPDPDPPHFVSVPDPGSVDFFHVRTVVFLELQLIEKNVNFIDAFSPDRISFLVQGTSLIGLPF